MLLLRRPAPPRQIGCPLRISALPEPQPEAYAPAADPDAPAKRLRRRHRELRQMHAGTLHRRKLSTPVCPRKEAGRPEAFPGGQHGSIEPTHRHLEEFAAI